MVFSGIKSVLWTLDIDTTARGILSGSFTFRVCTKSKGNGMVFTKWQRIWTFCQYAECLHESEATSLCSGPQVLGQMKIGTLGYPYGH